MSKKIYPALVVALYNRKEPAERVLKSLSEAFYPQANIQLIISIDTDGNNEDIRDLANDFEWKFGDKKVIFHESNLGIREHFNFCGDLTSDYETVVFIEDDLFLSRYYYNYTLQALDFFKDDDNIAGISLFSYTRIERWDTPLPFIPIDDGGENYFLQQASWGQIWTKKMWSGFMDWFKVNGKPEIVNSIKKLPMTVKGWPATSSWKKYYITYMIVNNKYYVFPRIGLAANFDDIGTNRGSQTTDYQSPLLVGEKEYRFKSFDDSVSIYDSCFELLPSVYKKFNPDLSNYDFEVNLYGDKQDENIEHELILSKLPGNKIIKSYGLKMKPHELNIFWNIAGNKIFLTDRSCLSIERNRKNWKADFVYYYRALPDLKEIISILVYKVKKKLDILN